MLKNLEPKLEEAQEIPAGGRTPILDLMRVGNAIIDVSLFAIAARPFSSFFKKSVVALLNPSQIALVSELVPEKVMR